MHSQGEVRWTDSNTWLFLRSTHLRKKTVYYNKIYLYRPQKNWNIIIWILLLQIYLKGPNVSKGYVHDPKKTAQTIDEDDWLHIGDIGLFIGGLFLLKLFKQHWQQNAWYLGLSLIHVKLDGCFFFCFLSNCVFSLSYYFTKLKNHLLKVSHLNLRIQKT